MAFLIDSVVLDLEEMVDGVWSYGTDMNKSPRKLVKESRIWSHGMERT